MNKRRIAFTSVFLACASFLAAAETNKWKHSAAAGLTLTRGNSDTLLGNLSLSSARKDVRDEILLGASGTYGTAERTREVTIAPGVTRETTEEETTTANANAFGQYNYLFSERWYGGVRADFLHDAIADVKYRVTISPLVGYFLIKATNTTLKLEAGPSGVFEKQGDESNQYMALRFGERFEHRFSPRSRVWQSLEYMPQIDRWGNYLIIAEVGAEASLTDKLALRAVLQDNYDNEPAPGRKKNDLKLITSLVYNF